MILGGIVRYAVSDEVWRYNLEHKDTTFSAKENVSIKANFNAFSNTFSWFDPVVEEEKEEFVRTKIVNYGKNANPDFINRLISLQDVYPIIAYYSSYRLLGMLFLLVKEILIEIGWMPIYRVSSLKLILTESLHGLMLLMRAKLAV